VVGPLAKISSVTFSCILFSNLGQLRTVIRDWSDLSSSNWLHYFTFTPHTAVYFRLEQKENANYLSAPVSSLYIFLVNTVAAS
jgi:hypothetical protein